MSSVEFVRNVGAHTTVYRWEAAGLEDLNRHNKLSTLPFWVPNAATRRHQFKAVLLRGLVLSASPASDPFGVLVELIPPPPPPVATAQGPAAVSSSASSSDYPGGCAVTCEVLPIDSTISTAAAAQRKAIVATKTAVLDTNNTQVSFPDFIPAEVLHNACYVRGAPKSFTLQITIETGISVPLHHAASTAFSFLSSLTTSVGHLLDNTAQLYHEGRESIHSALLAPTASALAHSSELWHGTTPTLSATTAAASAAPATAASSSVATLPPWEQPPEEWRGRAAEWRLLVGERLAGLDGTYRYGVGKTLSPDEVGLLAEVGLCEADLWALYSLFDFNRDVQEGLLASAEVRARRYRLVPARLKEETFWANYFWKVNCVGQCVTERQVAAVLVTLCMPARTGHTDLFAPVEGVLRHILDGESAVAVVEGFIKRGEAAEPWCTVAAETARHYRDLLDVASQRADLAGSTRQHVESTLSRLEEALSWYGDALEGPTNPPPVPVDSDAGAAADAAASVADEVTENVAAGPSPAPPSMKEAEAVSEQQQQQQPFSGASPDAAVLAAAEATASRPDTGTGDAPPNIAQVTFAKMPWEEEEEGEG
ncbi:hypothetical protein LSCM1_08144 [Leishmania martiniquensis]|uniref:BSD domain-containing protein n=1 Tax=Leishmania martiniquensis TaxID=1580590 RepID=A0A836I476_9TRYP|nr:hypothetical protein LSCM1_08144 [Leishmania martiniquensis]